MTDLKVAFYDERNDFPLLVQAIMESRKLAEAQHREQCELEFAKDMSLALTITEAAAASAPEDAELARAIELSTALAQKDAELARAIELSSVASAREDADMARAIALSAAESAERAKKAAAEQQKRADDAAATAAKLREAAVAAQARSNALKEAGYGLDAGGRIVRLRPSHAVASQAAPSQSAPSQPVPSHTAASPAKAPVPEFKVVGGESPTSGVDNNCLLQSLINICVIVGMTAKQIREMLITIVMSGAADNLVEYESVEDMLRMLIEGKQLGDVFVRILAQYFRKTIVVFKRSSDGKWTNWIHGKEYDNWNGCALLHRGDIGEFQEGHYTTFRLGAGTERLTIRGDSLPAIRP